MSTFLEKKELYLGGNAKISKIWNERGSLIFYHGFWRPSMLFSYAQFY